LHAAFYSGGRRRRFATETRVVGAAGGIELRRRRLGEGDLAPYVQRAGTETYRDGPALIELLAEAGDEELSSWLRRYRALLDSELAHGGPVPFDLWPGNLIVDGDDLVAVDTELAVEGIDASLVTWRGLLLTAVELAARTVPERWKSTTRSELVGELARAAGLDGPSRLDEAIELQARIYADIFGGAEDDAVEALRNGLAHPLAVPRDAAPGLRARAEAAEAERDALRAALDSLTATLAQVEGSKSWRLTAPLRSLRRRGNTS
jgi:hypothetical protein